MCIACSGLAVNSIGLSNGANECELSSGPPLCVTTGAATTDSSSIVINAHVSTLKFKQMTWKTVLSSIS